MRDDHDGFGLVVFVIVSSAIEVQRSHGMSRGDGAPCSFYWHPTRNHDAVESVKGTFNRITWP